VTDSGALAQPATSATSKLSQIIGEKFQNRSTCSNPLGVSGGRKLISLEGFADANINGSLVIASGNVEAHLNSLGFGYREPSLR